MVLMTVLNMLIFFMNINLIDNFKKTQIDFINQQNRNTVSIHDIKTELNMFERK